MRRLLRLIPYVRSIEDELERERMRLAACGVAALGYFDGCKPEYESASLGDVIRLWNVAHPDMPQPRGCTAEANTLPPVPPPVPMHRHGLRPGTTEEVLPPKEIS